jgi:copper transport protein
VEAHALLVRSDPPENSQLREPPTQITLFFSEALEQEYSRVAVINQDGEQVDDHFEFVAGDDAAMRVFLKPQGPGYLSVQWATVSKVDGHRISGSYPITITNPDGSLPAGQPASATSSTSGADAHPFRVVDKWTLLIAGSVLAGAMAFLVFVVPGNVLGNEDSRRQFHRIVWRAAAISVAVLIVAEVFELLFQSHDINASVSSVLQTQWGERWLYRTLLLIPLALVVGGLAAQLANRRLIAFVGLVLAGGYMVLTSSVSHGGAGGGSFWAIGSDFIHLSASSVWIGMLFFLVLLFIWTKRQPAGTERYQTLSKGLQRFSVIAAISVGLLMFTGTVNAVIELGNIRDLLNTGYGRALLLKLLLLVPLLAIAGYNAYLLRPDFSEAASPDSNVRDRYRILQELEQQLNRRIRYELGIAIAVLAVVALMVQLTPTRGRVTAPTQSQDKYISTVDIQDLQATLVITPNQPGFNTFEVYLAGGVDTVEGTRLEFTDTSGTVGESRLELDPSNPPTFYLGQGAFLSAPGKWNIVLNIRRSTGLDLRPEFKVDLESAAAASSSARTGGAFASPIDFGTVPIILLVLSGAMSVIIVFGSMQRPGMPEGYLGWFAAEAAYKLAPLNVRPVWTLGFLVVVGIALGLVLGNHLHPALSPEEASAGNPIPSSKESIARGAVLFDQNCAICHGESGRGDGPAAASLPLQPANLYQHIPYHPDQFFFGVISKGLSGVMPAFEGQISPDDRWNILNYLRDRFSAGDPAEK